MKALVLGWILWSYTGHQWQPMAHYETSAECNRERLRLGTAALRDGKPDTWACFSADEDPREAQR
jgi:hypothetical protein